MNWKFLFTLLISSSFSGLFSQTDTLNNTNSLGEKMGWWIIYLDDNLKQLDDTSGASYCRYTYYTGKFDHYNMGTIGSKKSPLIAPDSDTLFMGELKLLNGDYIANYKNGQVHFVLSAKDGILTEYKEYYSTGQLKTQVSYSKQCGAPIRACIKTFNKTGECTYDGPNRIPIKKSSNSSN